MQLVLVTRYRISITLFLILVLLGMAGSATAMQLAPYAEFQRINFSDYTDDQTNIGSITAITQDNRGFMWAGGENGLLRYDGHKVSLYRADKKNSIKANYVQDLIPDGSDYLWIATVGGISRLNLHTGIFDNVDASSNRLPGNDVLSIALNQDTLFLATSEGLGILDKNTLQTKTLPFTSQLPELLNIRYVYIFQDTLWLGTSHLGLIEINLTSNAIHYHTHNPNDPKSIPHSDIRGIFTYDGNTYWLASLGGGLIRYDRSPERFTQYSDSKTADIPFATKDIWGVYGDSRGFIWVGTDRSGLRRIDGITGKIDGYIHDPSVFESLSSNKARVTFEDNAQNLWVGNFSGILDYYNREQEIFIRYKKSNRFHQGLNHPSVLSILPAGKQRHWVGTEGGLNLINAQSGSQDSFTSENSGLLANPALALENDLKGNIWIGTWGGGLQRFNPASGQWYNLIDHPDPDKRIPSPYIWALENDNAGNLWVGTQKQGIYKLELASGDVTHYTFNAASLHRSGNRGQSGIVGEFVRDLSIDSQGRLWVASLHGLSLYDAKSNNFEVFNHDPNDPANAANPASNQVISLLHHSNGELWIGYRNAGLSIYNPKSQNFEHIGVAQGLPSTSVGTLQEDKDGNVWAGTPAGLATISVNDRHIKTYKQVHGLAGSNHNRNASFLDDKGRIWIGSTEGLSIFYPKLLGQTRLSSRPVISGIRINHGKNYDKAHWQNERALTEALPFDQNAISFDFSINQFYLPQLNEYQYRLKGLDEQWQTTMRHNAANYTNLDPGSYIFEVKGKSANGDWGEQVTQLSFMINSPPWRQWWAYILYACFAYAGFAAYRNYMAVRARSAVYEQLSQQDALTKLPNRIALNNRVELWQRQNLPFGVIVADLDHFKLINDTYGHEAGDLLLKEFSRIAAAEIRDCDLLGRWGGEEFLIICQTHEMEVIHAIAERIQKTMAMQSFVFHQQLIQMTVSFGCATCQESESFNDLFHRADQALYDAKANGRNRVVKAA